MSKIKKYNYLILMLFSIICCNSFEVKNILAKKPLDKISFWNLQLKGANIFNRKVGREIIIAAKKYNIKFIRLAPDKFFTKNHDFLLGTADNYNMLASEDLNKLRNVLDICYEEKMPVILTMLSLPGSRWKQHNDANDDLRIWESEIFQKQAANFWKDLANELRSHPAIIGYNILNEPHPERLYNTKNSSIFNVNQKEVQKKLFKFYSLVIRSIREVDTNTPIIIDSSSYGDPQTFKNFKIVEDPNIIYSFHIYEPYFYTSPSNNNRFSYPGNISYENGKEEFWNKEKLELYLKPVLDFQKRYNIPSNRILVGEFGGYRKCRGLKNYFSDLISIFNNNKWHFAFYAFREDVWDGMDYEIGSKDLPWNYWNEIEEGREPVVPRIDNPIFDVLKKDLK